MHVERKPGGGFAVHFDNPGTPGFNPAAQEKFDHHAEELLGFLDKHFPQLSEHIAAQVTGRELKVFTDNFQHVHHPELALSKMLLPLQPLPPSDAADQATSTPTIENSDFNQRS